MDNQSWKLGSRGRHEKQAADKKAHEEKRKKLLAKLAVKKTEPIAKPKKEKAHRVEPTSAPPSSTKPRSPLAEACVSRAESVIYDRSDPSVPLHAERWTRDLVDLMLEASTDQGIHICLVWPGRPIPLALLHAQATLARLAIKDLKGLRTMMFPVKQTSFHSFHHYLLDRDLLVTSVRQVWETIDGNTRLNVLRSCEGKSELLMALANIKNYKPDTPFPSISEVVPTFHYNPEKDTWGSYQDRFLARSITKIPLGYRRSIRDVIKAQLCLPSSAPDAIFGIPYGQKKATWVKAISKISFRSNPVELLLLDATSNMQRTHFKSVQQIPDFIESYRETLGNLPGVVIVTDNPSTAFSLKKRLTEDLGLRSVLHVYATESDETGFSSPIQSNEFTPALRGLRHYGVAIMDREACRLALTLQKSAIEFQTDPEMQQACMNVSQYLMQLCHLPGGYSDLVNWLDEDDRNYRLTAKLTWPNKHVALQRLLTAGRAGAFSRTIEQALVKADGFITNWTEATPMALRILREVNGLSPRSKHNLGLVFLQSSYIPIAERFLTRKLAEVGKSFQEIKSHLEFINFREFHKRPEAFISIERFIFVGATDDLLRVLLATDLVPAHSSLFLSYRQTYSYQQQLNILRSLEELRPYKGRVNELAQEFEQRLSEVQDPIDVDKLRVPNFNFDFEVPSSVNDQGHENHYWSLTLEGGETLHATKRVFKYTPDEDPAFSSINVENITIGDSVFCMTEELRDEVEAALRSNGSTSFSRGSSFSAMLDIYHQQVRTKSSSLFSGKNKRDQARKILERMIEINQDMKDCTLTRVCYWLDLDSTDMDRAPQAARDWKHFEIFAKALDIPELLYKDFWVYAINSTRREHQVAGRELSEFYTNILFHPESLQVYKKVPPKTIANLMQRAIDCIFKVVQIEPPADITNENP
jgi:hypothetical protein